MCILGKTVLTFSNFEFWIPSIRCNSIILLPVFNYKISK